MVSSSIASTRRPRRLLLVPLAVATAAIATLAASAFVPHGQPRLRPTFSASARCPQHAGAKLRGLVARAAAAEEAASEESSEGLLKELLELAGSAADDGGKALGARIDMCFGQISPEDLSELQMMMGKGDGDGDAERAQAVAQGIQAAIDGRMKAAKATLEDLIKNAKGDVNIGIKKCLKQQESPLPLLIVLQLNIDQAKADGDEEKLRAMLHINTVINEEMEKKVSRVRGLLNKLLRMDDAGIRENLLRHHLTPVEVAAPAGDDDDFDTPQLAAALVPPSRLASGISQLISDIDRQLRAAVSDEAEDRFEVIERIRLVAKEARIIIGDVYGEAEMDSFGADLTPAFTALMAYKARQAEEPAAAEQPAAEQPAQQAADLPPTQPLPP